MSRWGDFFSGAGNGDCPRLDPPAAAELMQEQDALLVDVREPHEYAAARIPDAELIPLRRLVNNLDVLKQHGDRPIILSCRSGDRSQLACRLLRGSGLENVYNLDGGIIAWARSRLPVLQ